jgi:hypothetical protein
MDKRSVAATTALMAMLLAGGPRTVLGQQPVTPAAPAGQAQLPDAPQLGTPIGASPGKSGGEGGGSAAIDAAVPEATKANPLFRSNVGQPAGPPSGDDPRSRCLRIAYADLTQLPDAPTQIVDAAVRPGAGGAPEVCVVNGFVAPQVAFRIWLPTAAWNAKFMQTGCGGRCGDILTTACEYQFTRGYACLANDLGHRGTTYDNVWAIGNIPGEIDFGFRATHVASIAGKAITALFYGRPPSYSYFVGASTGGRQALVEAQRFPRDFNGVLSGEPAMVGVPGGISGDADAQAGARILYANGHAVLTADEIRMLHAAVMARCDADDGLKDGIIGDPRSCAFQPTDLLCASAKTASCLTQSQVDVLRRVYDAGPLKGSELAWIGAFVAADGSAGRYISRTEKGYSYPYSWVFNDTTNPDIRPFKAAGGKLMLYVGWADEVVLPRGPVDYYETVERLVGSRSQTQDFFRFFAIPGQSHIPGNVGAESVDYVEALEAWVEHGHPPDRLVGHKLKRITTMMGPMYLAKDLQPANYLYSRPIYPYPVQARYKGRGDPDDADSFGPYDPVKKRWLK